MAMTWLSSCRTFYCKHPASWLRSAGSGTKNNGSITATTGIFGRMQCSPYGEILITCSSSRLTAEQNGIKGSSERSVKHMFGSVMPTLINVSQ